jgi:hypothetical protein
MVMKKVSEKSLSSVKKKPNLRTTSADISIIIVNYKVKEYIANLLNSIQKAQGKYNLQVIVIDNNSQDESITFLRSRFPNFRYIANSVNHGFGKANNQGIELAEGRYTLIINPDTLVSEDTFTKMIEHMEANPKCGACGCKILNPDGSFAPESKRSVPNLASSLSKVTGLSSMFPKSTVFGGYYMGWLHEDQIGEIEVLSGSFMFWKTEVLKQLNGFDERFFMYGEDIDLCYRIQSTGFQIHYVPTTSIIHYKGESSRKGDLKFVRIFNKALFQFFDKHYSAKYSQIFRLAVYSAITIRAVLSVLVNNFRLIGFIASDLILLNISVILGFLVRFQYSYDVVFNLQNLKYLWINLLASALYVLTGSALDLFRSQKNSISNQLKAIIISYSGVALITFFARNLAFSRLALMYGLVIALVLMLVLRLIQINVSRSNQKISGKLKRSRILLVGNIEDTSAITQKIHSRPDWNYEVIGTVGLLDSGTDYLGTLPQLTDLVSAYNIDQVFFALKSISYKDMLHHLAGLQQRKVIVKLIPDSMDFILGKSNVEYMESIPVVEVGFSHMKGLNPFLRRIISIVIITPATILSLLLTLPALLLGQSPKFEYKGMKFYQPVKQNIWKNRAKVGWYVIMGKMELVGAPLYYPFIRNYKYKYGLTGLFQLNSDKILTQGDGDNYELYYLQNYTIWMDIDILLKTMFYGFKTLDDLEKASNTKD